MGRRWPLLAMTLLLAGCTYGPVVDGSRFESAALLPDQRTVAVAYRVQRYRQATGLAAWPDGGIPRYLEDRAVVATVPLGGGIPRIMLRVPVRGVHGSAHVGLLSHDADPGHVVVRVSEQASTSDPTRLRWLRLSVPGGELAPYPDLDAELRSRGRTPGSTEFGPYRVLDRDGAILLGARGGPADELWLRRPNGEYQLIDSFKHFYGLRGDELYYWSGDEAVVRNWRTLEKRVIARYDPALRQTTRLIPDDPTFRALEGGAPEPALTVSVPAGGSEVRVERRGPAGERISRPLPIDVQSLRTDRQYSGARSTILSP